MRWKRKHVHRSIYITCPPSEQSFIRPKLLTNTGNFTGERNLVYHKITTYLFMISEP